MKKFVFVTLVLVALGGCAPRYYDDRDYRDRYYSDHYTPTPHGGMEVDRDRYNAGRNRDDRDRY